MRKHRVLLGLSVLLACAAVVFGTSDRNQYMFVGHANYGETRATMLTQGATDVFTVDCTSADQTQTSNASFDQWQNCRAISCDVAGIIKIDLFDAGGNPQTVVMFMNAGEMYPIRNVIVVYRYYVGTTACTAQSYNSSGSLITGLHLWR
jgi:hypothetical protein